MKRIFLLCTILLLLTGCTSIRRSNLDDILNKTLNSLVKTTNVNRNGYRYYLPKGLKLKTSKSFNEVLADDLYKYYLYVDIVRYNSKADFKYIVNEDAFYSKYLENNKKNGYIEINNYKNDQYLIEIMYNYAKIEVVVYESDINSVVTYAMAVLTSITYNDNVIDKYLSSSVLDGSEEGFDIFEIVGSDNYLQITDDLEQSEENKDPDYIN